MPVLFFMPWVACPNLIDLGKFQLVPYKRGKLPGMLNGISQTNFDAVLGSYGDPDLYPSPTISRHIQCATLLVWPDHQEKMRLDEKNFKFHLEQAQYVTFAALAQRRFGSYLGYYNTDGYQVFAQPFDENAQGNTAITTRRRDGSHSFLVINATAPRFIRPQHVDTTLQMDIDPEFVIALLRLELGKVKSIVDAAISLFVMANTDAPAMSERAEMVLMRVAFETLLGATHKTADLRSCFEKHFDKELPDPVKWHIGTLTEEIWRKRWHEHVNRPLDAWIQDFCAVRNAAAHGLNDQHCPPVWSRCNHLLFASWLFPLMVKKILEKQGLYSLSELDIAARQGCEAFLAQNVLDRVNMDKPELWWSYIERELYFDIGFKNLINATTSCLPSS